MNEGYQQKGFSPITHPSSGQGIPSRTLNAKEKKIFLLKDLEVKYNSLEAIKFYGRTELIWEAGHVVRIEVKMSEVPE